MNNDIAWALHELREDSGERDLARAYYKGDHNLAFATDKFRNAFGPLFRKFALNHCAIVVETIADRLQIAGWDVAVDENQESRGETLAKLADSIWARNRMQVTAGTVHQAALLDGEAYCIVWPDPTGEPVIYPNPAGMVAVEYDDEKPGYITKAAKCWKQDMPNGKRIRLTLYYPDRIEKYATAVTASCDMPTDPNRFMQLADEDWLVPNPYGKVPVFHFPNSANICRESSSVLRDVIPIQDALNKTVMDMMVGMEFAALPQRWATGIEIEMDETTGEAKVPFKVGVDRFLTVASEAAKFGEFQQMDVEKLLAVKESFRKDISLVAGIPAHYFEASGGNAPSGEALKTMEIRLTAKVRDLQVSWGEVWADVMLLCARIGGQDNFRYQVKWTDTTPRNALEQAQVATLKQNLGVPHKQLQNEMGYSEQQIADMATEMDAQMRAGFVAANADVIPAVAQ